jgi:hypothetical protein
MPTMEELKARQKELEVELKKVKASIKRFDQDQEREKVKQVRKLMDELGLTFEQVKPKERKPRKAKPAPAPNQAA